MSEIVFILGAGASVSAGAPTMKDFIDVARNLHAEGEVSRFSGEFEMVFKAISELQKVHSKTYMDIYNIEPIFSSFEMGRIIKKLPGVTDYDELIRATKVLIKETLLKSVKYPLNDGMLKPESTYNTFVDLILNINKKKDTFTNRCAIMTFNYDVALDHAFYSRSGPPNYCLEDNDEETESKKNEPRLMKLHGSIHWNRCPKCEIISPVDLASVQPTDYRELKTTMRDLEDVKCVSCNVMSEPFIIPPTWNKSDHYSGIQNVWRNAAKALTDAEYIFILGYSYPRTDEFFNYLFALGTEGNSIIRKLIVYNPDSEVNRRIQSMLGMAAKDRYKFANYNFVQAISAVRSEIGIARN